MGIELYSLSSFTLLDGFFTLEMFAEQSLPCLNDPAWVRRFLIFAMDWRVTATLVPKVHNF